MAYTAIDLPTDYFNTVLYTGNGTAIGSGGQAITGVGFAPDWTWIKERSSTSPHKLLDTIRGATKELESNGTNLEATTAESLASFDSDGFTVGNNGAVNQSSQTYASWNWLAGGSASSNTNGSITSSVSANTTAGFSIVSYTGNGSAGATVGHGLGTTPAMVIQKRRSGSTASWVVWHKSIHDTSSNNKVIFLNLTDASASGASDTIGGVSSTLITTAGTGAVNPSGDTCIMYCFAEVQGYSKFGSYKGNGNADGTFVYTGFKPAWIMIKKSSGTENWSMYDTKRNVNGTTNTLPLNADNTSNEDGNTGKNMDILSNGVKMYTSNGELNGSGDTYIYMAFAESPFVSSKGIPTTAR